MPYQPKQRLRLVEDFTERVARAGLSLRAFAASADVSYSTIQAAINPSQQPNRNPHGGMYARTAWKLANAYAAAARLTPDAAYDAIIVTESVADRQPQEVAA